VDRLFRAVFSTGAAQCLAIDGDDLGRRLGQCCGLRKLCSQSLLRPIDETALKGRRVERGENIAQMILRGRAVAIAEKSAQEVELLFAKAGDVGERLGPRQHREKAEQQDFIEPIGELAGLPMSRHISEITEENCRLG